MKLGAPFLGAFRTRDPLAIRDYVQAVESLGYDFLAADEILLSDDPHAMYHESLTLFSYLAAVTTRLDLVTGIIVLPKRSTIMVAKQAAEVDVLSGGRLKLGIGVGWNEREFQALGIDFHTRGRRIEEQIELLKALWTQSKVTFKGEFHSLEAIGINLLPVQRPIPIWIGGGADVVLRRAARMGDGWIADESLSEHFGQVVGQLRTYLEEYGRASQDFSIMKYLRTGDLPEDECLNLLRDWRDLGVTHVSWLPSEIDNLQTLDDYVEMLRRVRAVTLHT